MDDQVKKSRGVQFYFKYYKRKKNKFELYTDLVDKFSFTELKSELEEILDISNILQEHIQDEIIGPRILKYIKKKRDGLMVILC